MRGRIALGTLAMLMLAACDHHSTTQSGQSVHVAVNDGTDKVSLDMPGFAAKLNVPGLNLAKATDLDGIHLAKGTTIKTINVDDKKATADGKSDSSGQVKLDFAAPQTPAELVAYYREQAEAAGYVIGTTGAGSLNATKGAKSFTLTASADGAGSRGTILLIGD